MAYSENGWSVISSDQTKHWAIPGLDRLFDLREKPAGFVLAHLLLWFHEEIEPVNVGIEDEWGHYIKKISGTDTYSNHSSGTAIDINAVQHPWKVKGTFSFAQRMKIKVRLLFYRGVVRWGGNYDVTVDEMHWEINKGYRATNKLYWWLRKSPRGKRLIAVNPRDTFEPSRSKKRKRK